MYGALQAYDGRGLRKLTHIYVCTRMRIWTCIHHAHVLCACHCTCKRTHTHTLTMPEHLCMLCICPFAWICNDFRNAQVQVESVDCASGFCLQLVNANASRKDPWVMLSSGCTVQACQDSSVVFGYTFRGRGHAIFQHEVDSLLSRKEVSRACWQWRITFLIRSASPTCLGPDSCRSTLAAS